MSASRWNAVRRLGWLAAWLGWAYLGWRLFNALPRDGGPPLATLENAAQFAPFAFLSDSETVVAGFRYSDLRIRRWNARTGQRHADLAIPSLDQQRHGDILLTGEAASESRLGAAVPAIIDLKSGLAARLPFRFFNGYGVSAFHPCKPWLALAARLPADSKNFDSGISRVIVWDYQASRMLLCLPPPATPLATTQYYKAPRFPSDADLVIVVKEAFQLGEPPTNALELWQVPGGPAPKTRLTGIDAYAFLVGSLAGGRFAVRRTYPSYKGYPGDGPIETFDALRGTPLFSGVGPFGRPRVGFEAVRLSSDGTVLLDEHERCARNTATGVRLWSWDSQATLLEGAGNRAVVFNEAPRKFPGIDWWDGMVGRRFPTLALSALLAETHAERDWRTGAILRRVRHGYGAVHSPDGRLAIDEAGQVRPWPPPANGMLWCGVLAMTAAPLLLAHAVAFGWSRHRRVRPPLPAA